MSAPRAYRAGETIEDLCRACKADRMHTVVVVDAAGEPIRVVCGFCHSEHNYRGGPRPDVSRSSGAPAASSAPRSATSSRTPFPIVSERERTFPMSVMDTPVDLELLLRRIIREETGVTPVVPAEKWR